MQTINIQRFSLAFGVAFALLYVGCVIVMAILGKQNTVVFFNSLLPRVLLEVIRAGAPLFHGLDVRLIIRMDVPLKETVNGIIETFILGWLSGAVISLIYNFGSEKQA